MNNKSKRIKNKLNIIISIIILICIIPNVVKAGTQSFGGIPPHMYDWDGQLFSAVHGASLGAYDTWGNPSTATIYDTSYESNATIEPSVGYAYYVANKMGDFNQAEIQKIIWSSKQWNNESNMLDSYVGDTTQNVTTAVSTRSYQYGTVYYQILKEAIEGNKNLFKTTIPFDAVKVMVNQDEKRYTVGPYNLELNTKAYKESATFLYNEIIGNNTYENSETQFAKYTGVTGLNGTNAIFKDSNGNQIAFPNFVTGELFYIEFTPNNDGSISETGNPIINVKYLSNFTADELIKYNPKAIQFGGRAGDYESGRIVNSKINNSGDNYYLEYITRALPGETEEEAEARHNSEEFQAGLFSNGLVFLFELSAGLLGAADVVGAVTNFAQNMFITAVVMELNNLNDGYGEIVEKGADAKDIKEIGSKTEGVSFLFAKLLPDFTPAMVNRDTRVNMIERLNAGEITREEFQYASRIADRYWGDAENYQDWIDLKDNEYKLSLEMIMQAYGSNTVPHELVTNRNITSSDVTENTTTDPQTKKKTVDSRNVYAEMEGKAKINVNIPVMIGSGSITVNDVEVDVKRSFGRSLVPGSKEWKDYVLNEYSEPWEITKFSSGEKEYQIPPTMISAAKNGKISNNNYKNKNYSFNKIANSEEDNISTGRKISNNKVIESYNDDSIELPGKIINMQIGGVAWVESSSSEKINGLLTEEDRVVSGIQVMLYEKDNCTLIATTTADKYGMYRFYGLKEEGTPLINPLKKYYVKFTYNGQMYQNTYYKNDLTGYYSNAKEEDREIFNETFKTINSDPKCYYKNGEWHKSYGLLQRIEKDNGEFAEYEGSPVTLYLIIGKFIEKSCNKENNSAISKDSTKIWDREKTYDWVLDGEKNPDNLKNWLNSLGVYKEADSIIQFIRDTQIEASTKQNNTLYPVYNKFVINDVENNIDTYLENEVCSISLGKNNEYKYLYTKNSDQARFINMGITPRTISNLSLQKDIYKTTLVVNGKKQDYIYNYKELSMWKTGQRALNDGYNERAEYYRRIRKSDYLYDGSDSDTTDDKNLQAYVTYRITAINRGDTKVKIDEIVDYYDTDTYEFDGTLNGNQYSIKKYNNYDENGNVTGKYENSYIGKDKAANKLNDNLVVKNIGINNRTKEDLVGENYHYGRIYLTGITSLEGNELLDTGEMAFVYLTFKVKRDDSTGKLKIDQALDSGNEYVGKKNMAEINAYSTYYKDQTKIPDALNSNDSKKDKVINGDTTPAGIIDADSTPGNIETVDLDSNGNIITGKVTDEGDGEKAKFSLFKDRQEDDQDKAPNLKLLIDQNEENTRRFNGITFEDERNTESGNAIVGNGKFSKDDGDKKINGVTVKLMELIQDVDENGIFKGTYSGEREWQSYTYKGTTSDGLNTAEKKNIRYTSGEKESKVILSGNGILTVNPKTLEENEGQYEFTSVPAGDFYIKFVYGDDYDTVLTNNENNEVNKLISSESKIIKGRNEKSYNGQDYKTTTYQKDINQNTRYNGIDGYQRYDTQNYTSEDGKERNNGTAKASMYNYDIAESDKQENSSDAKDVWYSRQKTNEYSKGENGNSLLNNRAEVLSSFEKISTYKPYTYNNGSIVYRDIDPLVNEEELKNIQISLLDELMKETQMEAQTGIINTEIEYNRTQTKTQSSEYSVRNINLGLIERPESQLKLINEVTGINITLADGKVLFDTDKSVNNLFFSEHQSNTTHYRDNLNNKRLTDNFEINSENKKVTAETIQAYIDNELQDSATVNLKYKLSVENVGEVDYLDKKILLYRNRR